ncbi:hypothetical protein L228DRAFT_236258 [Xylona heveae TC161]|uniref:Uncharacterized protein n=1 Tax=Xylona heveae (strain CBS 132557 / TC161) TaxID=1328760 RepID=A0A165IN49_XYLHT|nr:hypothetical protein L228DRAFT_236258 [Xylona heveae TC161]KZF25136.1 hypothetical protein L228DRAFT_236258 [Xylona heveae TC161]
MPPTQEGEARDEKQIPPRSISVYSQTSFSRFSIPRRAQQEQGQLVVPATEGGNANRHFGFLPVGPSPSNPFGSQVEVQSGGLLVGRLSSFSPVIDVNAPTYPGRRIVEEVEENDGGNVLHATKARYQTPSMTGRVLETPLLAESCSDYDPPTQHAPIGTRRQNQFQRNHLEHSQKTPSPLNLRAPDTPFQEHSINKLAGGYPYADGHERGPPISGGQFLRQDQQRLTNTSLKSNPWTYNSWFGPQANQGGPEAGSTSNTGTISRTFGQDMTQPNCPPADKLYSRPLPNDNTDTSPDLRSSSLGYGLTAEKSKNEETKNAFFSATSPHLWFDSGNRIPADPWGVSNWASRKNSSNRNSWSEIRSIWDSTGLPSSQTSKITTPGPPGSQQAANAFVEQHQPCHEAKSHTLCGDACNDFDLAKLQVHDPEDDRSVRPEPTRSDMINKWSPRFPNQATLGSSYETTPTQRGLRPDAVSFPPPHLIHAQQRLSTPQDFGGAMTRSMSLESTVKPASPYEGLRPDEMEFLLERLTDPGQRALSKEVEENEKRNHQEREFRSTQSPYGREIRHRSPPLDFPNAGRSQPVHGHRYPVYPQHVEGQPGQPSNGSYPMTREALDQQNYELRIMEEKAAQNRRFHHWRS